MIRRAICILLFVAAHASAFAPLIAEHRASPIVRPAEQSPVDCAYLPDGTLVYACSSTNSLYTLAPGSERPNQLAVPALGKPGGICTTPDGAIYIADRANHQIIGFRPGQRGSLHFGAFGHEGEKLCKPSDVSVEGNIIAVADTGNSRVQLFDTAGQLVRSIGQWGSGEADLVRPVGVAIHAGELFVCDEAMHRISVFSLDGTFQRTFGSLGEQDGQLLRPMRISVHNDQLFVTDTRNHRVQVFDPKSGETVGRWGEHALRAREHMGKLESPTGVAVSPDGRTAAITEELEGRVQLFDMIEPRDIPPIPGALGSPHYDRFMAGGPDTIVLSSPDLQTVEVYDLSGVREGKTPILVTRFGQQGWGFGKFVRIAGLAFDEPNQLVYVTDSAQRRLSIWKLDREPDDEQRFVPTMARLVQTIDFTALRDTSEELQAIPPLVPGAIAVAESRVFVGDERAGSILTLGASVELERVHAPISDEQAHSLPVRAYLVLPGFVAACDERGQIRICMGDEFPYRVEKTNAGDVLFQSPGVTVVASVYYRIRFFMFPGEGWSPLLKRSRAWPGDEQTKLSQAPLFHNRFGITDLLPIGSDLVALLDYGNHRVLFANMADEPISILGPRPFVNDARQELKALWKARRQEAEE